MDIGTNMRNARIRAGLSMTELAEKVGLSHVAIVKYESGQYLPNIATAHKIAKACRCDMNEFVKEDEE